MRRAIVGSLGVVLLSALGAGCGSPPEPMTGHFHFSHGCRAVAEEMIPGCVGGGDDYSGGVGSGSPPLQLLCQVQRSENGPNRLRFLIVRGGTVPDEGVGISVCGQIGGEQQEMSGGTVSLFFNGTTSKRNALGDKCQVFIKELGTDSFSGRIRCIDAPDSTSPPRLRFISGVGGQTEMPDWADFEFSGCTETAVICN
jgi:hypothetical protein